MLLATAIAGYAFWLLAVPAARPPFLLTSPVPLAVLTHFTGGGLLLAPFSQGGLTAHLGFGALALLTLGTTARAFQLVRQGNITKHRRWMIRSFSLILAGVTLRLQIPASIIAGVAFESAYPVIAWACWVPNLLLAEWMLRRRMPRGLRRR